eukprot:scaffold48_cov395-Prasinococcus_capsulatus_cf.AAC.42
MSQLAATDHCPGSTCKTRQWLPGASMCRNLIVLGGQTAAVSLCTSMFTCLVLARGDVYRTRKQDAGERGSARIIRQASHMRVSLGQRKLRRCQRAAVGPPGFRLVTVALGATCRT